MQNYINKTIKRTSHQWWSYLIVLSFGIIWIWVLSHFGLGLKNDSVSYIRFALEMHYESDFSTAAYWPPLTPFLIHFIMFFIPSPVEAVVVMNGVSLLLTLLLFLAIGNALEINQWVSIILISVFLTLPLTLKFIYFYPWSEPVFLLLITVHVYFLISYDQDKHKSKLLIVSLTAGLLCISRYIGYMVLPIFWFYLFRLVYKKHEKLVYIAAISLASLVPAASVLIHNYLKYSSLHGKREGTPLAVISSFNLFVKTIMSDFGIFLIILFCLACLIYIYIVISLLKPNDISNTPLPNIQLIPSVYFGGLTVSFFVLLSYGTLVLNSSVIIHHLDRFVFPLYLLILLFVLSVFSIFQKITKSKSIRTYMLGASVFLGLLVMQSITHFPILIDFGDKLQKNELRFTNIFIDEPGFESSQVAAWIQEYFKASSLTGDITNVMIINIGKKGEPGSGNLTYSLFFRDSMLSDLSYDIVEYSSINNNHYSVSAYNNDINYDNLFVFNIYKFGGFENLLSFMEEKQFDRVIILMKDKSDGSDQLLNIFRDTDFEINVEKKSKILIFEIITSKDG